MRQELEIRCAELLSELDLITPDETISATSLTGGVASDIAMVKTNDSQYCVKFALPKLKVEADWFAPVHRNAAEYAWLQFSATAVPEGAIKLYGQSPKLYGFAMEFLDNNSSYLWKQHLLDEAPVHNEAALIGDFIGKVHQASAKTGFDSRAFQNRDDFKALRLEPYLLYTATHHDSVAEALHAIADELYNNQQVLVHGDVSPKNIFFKAGKPIILDAECATMGDASFDLAFCINHLVLKALHLPASTSSYLDSAVNLWNHYSPLINWESADSIEARVCRLLPALMLARVDGKSPVEYLTDNERTKVRQISLHYLISPVTNLSNLIAGIKKLSKESSK